MGAKEIIAARVAKEIKDGDVVNLGIGLPTLVVNYIPEDIHITLHSENGILGMKATAEESEIDKDIFNAGSTNVTVFDDASFFDSAMSFAITRGGHVDVAVLGALQVDEKGNLASHIIPGKMVPGMGGAMDLVVGSRNIIVSTLHTAGGSPKILKNLTLPATAVGKVNMIVTELCVIKVTERGLVLAELSEGVTAEQVQGLTEAELIIETD